MNRVAIAGVGYSTVGRNTGLTAAQLGVQAAKAAMEDSGLGPRDVDGRCSYCSSGSKATENAMSLGWMLGLMPATWVSTTGLESAAFMHPFLEAVAAVQAGQGRQEQAARRRPGVAPAPPAGAQVRDRPG